MYEHLSFSMRRLRASDIWAASVSLGWEEPAGMQSRLMVPKSVDLLRTTDEICEVVRAYALGGVLSCLSEASGAGWDVR
jgi:hypothetical protein